MPEIRVQSNSDEVARLAGDTGGIHFECDRAQIQEEGGVDGEEAGVPADAARDPVVRVGDEEA